jgi:MSHA biogenesis protein MshP
MNRAQAGFSIMTAIFLIVILALLGVFIVSVLGLQQSAVSLDILGARAYQAARAGIEWGAFQTLRNDACGGTTLTFAGTSLEGYTTTVTCSRTTANEGGATVNTDQYEATACNQPPCPAAAPGANYAERRLRVVVSR